MALNERQSERVARFLDGERIELTEVERAAAGEFRRDEEALESMLPAFVPDKTMARARRRMVGALGRPGRLSRRLALGVGTAAAAAILIAAVAIWLRSTPTRAPEKLTNATELLVEVYSDSYADVDLDLLAEELEYLEAEMVVSRSGDSIETELDDLERSLEMFWLEDDDGAWLDAG